MKRILIFSLAYYPHVGGAEVAIKEITRRITDVEWHLVTLRMDNEKEGPEKIDNVTVHRVGSGNSYISKILFIVQAAHKARELHRTEHFDALWAMMSYMILPIVLLRSGLPYVVTLQEGDTYQHMFGRLRILPFLLLLRSGFRNASVVQVISTHLAEWARRRGYSGKIEVIPNGCDTWWFAENPVRDRKIFWKNHNGGTVSDNDKILITTSRLVQKNAIDTVIQSLNLLPNNIKFFILGEGPLRFELERLTHKLGLFDRVKFLGQDSNTEVVGYLHAADIFVRPSRSEGMGNSFIEAFAAGLPVIATQEGGLKDFISPEVSFVVEKNRPDQIALQVKAILGNPESTARVIDRARKLVQEKYDWDLIAKNMRERVFAKVL